jgi:glycosyltransferase involved in cell wall biosynthesis
MDIVSFSHLRWDFVFQRPQHLLTRFADHFRIFYIEESLFHAESDGFNDVLHSNVHVIKIHLKGGDDQSGVLERQTNILRSIFIRYKINEYILWFYTPMALPMIAGMNPVSIVYDCMDELSAFKFAPPALKKLEAELMDKADVVFTGGNSLYAAKKHQHSNIHSFPSSIDKKHFALARNVKHDPADQASIPHPRFGFYGVIDERFDIELIREVAEKRPEWQIVLIGPVVKIDPAHLPKNANIHYLGGKQYSQLPHYLGGWDIAMVSFAMNESTKYISPTKTPEYLAGGKPVISTPIRDVVESYGINRLVHIAENAEEFIEHAEKELALTDRRQWLQRVDAFLAHNSWDHTVKQMRELVYKSIAEKQVVKDRQTSETFNSHYLVVKGTLPAAS